MNSTTLPDTVLRCSRPAIHQLAAFLAVAHAGSFTAAARLLGTTQPAVSQTIRRLEDIYGGDLFERGSGKPLTLTPIGEAVMPLIRAALDLIDRQIDVAARTAQGRHGSLSLGFGAGFFAAALRTGIVRFAARAPDVRLLLVEDSPRALSEQLQSRALDLIVTPSIPPLDDPRFDQEVLWEERLVAVIAADHALATNPALDWDMLARTPLIMRAVSDDGLRARMGPRHIDSTAHAVSHGVLFDLVGLGVGVSIVAESETRPQPGIVFRPILEENARITMQAVWPRDDRNPLRHAFLTVIREQHSILGSAL